MNLKPQIRSESPGARVQRLIKQAKKELESLKNLGRDLKLIRQQYTDTKIKVSALPTTPSVQSLEDLPVDFIENYLDNVIDASDAVNSLKIKTTALLHSYFNISIVSTNESNILQNRLYEDTDLFHDNLMDVNDDTYTDNNGELNNNNKKSKLNIVNDDDDLMTNAADISKMKLRYICDCYEVARQIVCKDLKESERLVKLLMVGGGIALDEVVFSARGELVTASRSSLLKSDKSFFYGLLNSGKWQTDCIGAHAIDDDPCILQLVIKSIEDKASFFNDIAKLDSCTREYLNSRLDYYQIATVYHRLRVGPSISIDHCTNGYAKVTRTNSEPSFEGVIWDSSISKYSISIEASRQVNIMLGFAPMKLFNSNNANYTSSGWYLSFYTGTLYAQNGVCGKAYGRKVFKEDIITCIYNASMREISFEKNGVSIGVAYRGVIGEDIAPAVYLCTGDCITLRAAAE